MFNRNANQPVPPGAPGSYGPNAPFGWNPAGSLPGQATQVDAAARQGLLTMSFLWMFLALLVSAGAAGFVIANETALQFVVRNFFILVIAELAFVFIISLGINRIGALPALAMLFAYALLNGATISVIVIASRVQTGSYSGVLTAFLGASAIFGAAAFYGAVTKRDLTRLGGLLFMGLIGLIVVSLLNAFIFHGTTLDLVIAVVGVLIFTGLTAFHVQRLNSGQLYGVRDVQAASVVGALLLYLDFVNLFLMLLRIFGSNRR